MSKPQTVQMLANSLLSEVLFTQGSIDKLRRRLDALKGDMDPRDYRAAIQSLRTASDALTTINQIANRIETRP